MSKYRRELSNLQGQRDTYSKIADEMEASIEMVEHQIKNAEKARKIVQIVSQSIQESLKVRLEPLVSTALEAVWEEEAFKFLVNFEQKRNKTEATLLFERDGISLSPLGSMGYGVVDVATFALRLAVWVISTDRTDAVFILDEPFKHASEDIQERVMAMVQILSKKLGVQIIIVTHTKESDVMENSDVVFRMSKRGMTSDCKQVQISTAGGI